MSERLPARPLPRRSRRCWTAAAVALAVSLVAGCSAGSSADGTPVAATAPRSPSTSGPVSVGVSPSRQAVTRNVYAGTSAGDLTPVTRRARPLVYVPNLGSNTVDVIDPRTYKIVRSFPVPAHPQHVVPSWDLRTLWVNDNKGNMLTPVDPTTGKPGRSVPVDDPYNLYFSPDGKHAIVMAEARERIDFRDPHTMKLQRSLRVPCRGVNHADFTADLSAFLVSCEYSGDLLVVPASGTKVRAVIDLNTIRTPGATDAMTAMHGGGPAEYIDPGTTAMPQDVRLAPDGRTFVVADMLRNGIWLIDAGTFKIRGFVPTGKGAHGIYPSRDASVLYVSNRDEGTISVVDAATLSVRTRWSLPGGGSPDMGGVTADGRQLWLSGRSDGVVYVIDTTSGTLLKKIKVGLQPHGVCVWPQPGHLSLGHTGNMR
jgi:YVTN family beta-propeller protein